MDQQRLEEIRALWQQAKDCDNVIIQGRMDIHLIGMMPELLDEIKRMIVVHRKDKSNEQDQL